MNARAMPAVYSGPQRQALAAPVLERVHLLGDDVRGLAERAREHLGELEHRRRDLVVAVARRDLAPGLDHLAMAQRGLAHDVVGAADGAKVQSWGPFARCFGRTTPGVEVGRVPRRGVPPGADT